MTKMRDSGIDWIREIPEEWKVVRLKDCITINNGRDYKDIEVLENGFPVIGSGGQFAYASKYLYDGVSILLGRKGTIDKPLYVEGKFWTVDTMFYCIPKKTVNAKFIYYVALQIPFDFYSTNTALPSMTQSDLQNHHFGLPSLSEQIKISNYLDEKVAQLDKAKTLLEEQIATLQDYRQSLIYETVTKGLDKTVPMKDSGVDWIGEIPDGWEIGRLKHFYNLFAGGDIREDNFSIEYSEKFCYPVLSNSKENNGIFGYSDIFRFEQGTVTVTGRGDIGYAEYRDYRYFPIIRLLVCVPYVSVDGRYTTYWINSSVIEKNQTAIPQLTRFTLGELPFPRISLGEQIEIAAYLDKKVNQINQMIDIKQKQIENINQQRQTLIYDVVTGKRRV